jgi:hypothetical protein
MKDIDARIGFVRELALPPVERTRGPAAAPPVADRGPGAFVDNGALLSFVAGVSAQHQMDALNSLLLAQMAANKKFDREANVQQWYDFYVTVLGKIGWVIQGMKFQRHEASGSTVKMDQVVLEILGTLAVGGPAVALVTSALNALRGLADADSRLTLWDRGTRSASGGAFQVGTASEAGGRVALDLAAFHFSAQHSDTRFLWFGFQKDDVKIHAASQAATLNDEIYQLVRAEVVNKLGDSAKTFVGALEI